MKNSVREVGEYKKKLLSMLKKAPGKGAEDGHEWLCDNAVLLAGCLDGWREFCRKNRKTDAQRIFALCRKAAKDGVFPDKASLCALLFPLSPTVAECEAFLPALRAGYAAEAVNAVNTAGKTAFCVKSVRALAELDEEELFPEVCETEKTLLADPAGIYGDMAAYTKREYRLACARKAEKEGVTEKEAAAEALSNAKNAVNGEENHVGFFLPLNEKKRGAKVFLFFEFFLSAVLCLLFAWLAETPWLLLITPLPVYAFIRTLGGIVSAKLFPPRRMFSLDSEAKGVYLPGALITVSSILPDAENAKKEYDRFAALRASDSSPDTAVLALFDRKTAKEPFLASDKADTNAMKAVFDRLNADFGGGFIMAVRDRVFSPTENEYTGHERKRGAVCALVRLLADGENGFSLLYGDTDKLKDKKYILALDSDTELSFEALHRLLCIACHPLNRAVYSPDERRIKSGFGCIVPRTETSAASSYRTLFSSLFTSGGATAYSPAVSERYMDMFGTSLFTGKGLIDVRAYAETCLDAFEDGKILSHDIPEGALLRTGFAGDVVLTDSFPSSPSSYFRRAERWIRGDIQNAALLWGGTSHKRSAPRLSALSKYQLADNIRSALTPLFCFLCLLAGAAANGETAFILLMCAVLGTAGGSLLSCLRSLLSGGLDSLTRTFFSSSVSQSLRDLLRAITELGALPENAAVSTFAAAKAAYRMLVSKKHTLQWTTASASETLGGKQPVFSVLLPLASALWCIYFSIAGAVFGLLILCFIPFALSGGITLPERKKRLSRASREVLLSYMASTWDYFAENVNAAENHLPPDNVQETPVRQTAHRTSPTNIGLYLVSAMAAADVSLISSNELYERLDATFTVLKGLMKRKGLLYNWYDTKTLLPMSPMFVSAVDCGNYEICLTALKEGLREYAAKDARFERLREDAERLLNEGDMTVLFNKKRGLFSIGLDGSSGKLSDSYYDLFMSEAVMTSYYHIGRRDIPPSHWAKLGRPLVRAGRYTAAVSWSGTMFEYFMPTLFLPVYENTFRSEALKVCLHEQKKAASGAMPWGVSESACCAFDPSLSYRYRANGIRRLALKRNADCGKIFSPYSAFLALSLDPEGAVKDLAKFASLHAVGRWGFYEAVDFSTETGVKQDYMLVRSYMAHHVGMSIIACANAVNGDVFVKRFMRDPDMLSANSLLYEKIPFDEKPSKHPFVSKEKKETPPRVVPAAVPTQSGACVYSNGEDAFFCDEYGRHRFIHSSLSVLGYSGHAQGVFAGISVNGGSVHPLTGEKGKLGQSFFLCEKEIDGIGVKCAPALLNNFSALAAPVKITNGTEKAASVTLLYYFEPELLPPEAPSEHPAFTDMAVRTAYDASMRAVTFARNAERGGAFAAGLYDGGSFSFCCDREKALGRAPHRRFPFSSGLPEFGCETQTLSPCGAIRVDLRLAPGKKCEKVLLIAADETAKTSLTKLAAIRAVKLPDVTRAAPPLLKNDPAAAALPGKFAANVYFGAVNGETAAAIRKNTLPVSALWSAGISGDLPIISVYSDSVSENALMPFFSLHTALSVTGTANDLVFLTSFPSDYLHAVPPQIAACMKRTGGENHLGERGGIHVVSLAGQGEAFRTLLKALPGLSFPQESGEETVVLPPETTRAAIGLPGGSEENHFIPNGYHVGTKGVRPWCHTLSNAVFGTLLTDSSLGYTWAFNARQNKLTPWSNDVNSDLEGEKLFIRNGGILFDAVAGADATFYDDKAVFTAKCGLLSVRITVQTDARAMKKRISVKLSGERNPDAAVILSIRPQLADRAALARFVRPVMTDGKLILTNPASEDYAGYAAYYADSPLRVTEHCGEYRLTVLPEAGETEIVFYNVFSRSLRGVDALTSLPFREPEPQRVRFTSFSQTTNLFASALLLHNVYDTRFRARTGFYQCSGAYGFRDQLQDAAALLPFYPETVKRHILRSCAAQFPEGDVLHWYHIAPFGEPCFRGVKTHCSDDFLWLPLTAAEYINTTKDQSILRLPVAFLGGEKLSAGEKERYGSYFPSGTSASVYEHCVRAIKHSFTFGAHGLPLIKAGDWNDSFSEVGAEGKGESVWLAQFLRLVCLKFLPVCDLMKREDDKRLFLRMADKMKEAVLQYGFNGKYFLRGYYDDGTPLGEEGCDACRIDLLPQAFAVLSGTGSDAQCRSALLCAFKELYDAESKTLKLFTPPFGKDTKRAGYVNDYPAGVRENGGQYTHAAVWFALALKKAGLKEEARRLCEILCPANRYADEKNGKIFLNEPYAMTGDVCTEGALNGKGGWSLYTGSAGWYLRLLRELEKD